MGFTVSSVFYDSGGGVTVYPNGHVIIKGSTISGNRWLNTGPGDNNKVQIWVYDHKDDITKMASATISTTIVEGGRAGIVGPEDRIIYTAP